MGLHSNPWRPLKQSSHPFELAHSIKSHAHVPVTPKAARVTFDEQHEEQKLSPQCGQSFYNSVSINKKARYQHEGNRAVNIKE